MASRTSLRRAVVLLAAPIAIVAGATGVAADTTEPDDLPHVNLTMGGTQASSSAFAFLSALAGLASDADGNMTINVRETGTSHENIQLLGQGAVQFGLAGLRTPSEARQGLGQYEGQPIENLCTVLNVAVNAEYITVREDAEIETINDLAGQPFAPGFQGTGLYDSMLYWFSVLGIEVDVFDGSLEDVVNAIKDGRIVGFGKASAGFRADASMLDVQSVIDVEVIGFAQEDVDAILADSPQNEQLYQFQEVPAGTIYDNEEPFLTSIVTTNLFSDTDQPEEDVYRLTKALWEALPEAAEQTNYAGAIDIAPEATTDTADVLPLCPGSQRFFEEIAG